MLKPVGSLACSASTASRSPEDDARRLVCRHHLADLRQLRPYEADRLSRYLRVTFAYKLEPAPVERDDERDGDGIRLQLV